jgi:hypothetical protein
MVINAELTIQQMVRGARFQKFQQMLLLGLSKHNIVLWGGVLFLYLGSSSRCHRAVHDKEWQQNPKIHRHDFDQATLAVFGLGVVSSALAKPQGYRGIPHTRHSVYEHFVPTIRHEKCNSTQPFVPRVGALHLVGRLAQYPSKYLLREEKELWGGEEMGPPGNAP